MAKKRKYVQRRIFGSPEEARSWIRAMKRGPVALQRWRKRHWKEIEDDNAETPIDGDGTHATSSKSHADLPASQPNNSSYSESARESVLRGLKQLEFCRPRRRPYGRPTEVIGTGLADFMAYGDRLLAHLRKRAEVSQKERRYLSLLASVFARETSVHGKRFKETIASCWPPVDSNDREDPSVKSTKRLPWRVLPPGELAFTTVRSHFKALSKQRRDLDWDLERLDFAQNLKPTETWIGQDDFDGYVIFLFARTKAALLDHPIKGNACFILRGRWRELSHLPKGELLDRHPRLVIRVVHHEGWKNRVRNAMKRLKLSRRAPSRKAKKQTRRPSR